MKSKIIIFITILVIATVFTGCGTVTEPEVPIVIEPDEPVQENDGVIGYEVIKKLSENADNNSKIFYPQITGFKGELLMDYMNQTLAKINNMYGENENYQDVSVDYEITKMNNDILSVLYKGTAKVDGDKQINIQTSVNLDIKTSNPIDFQNLVDADSESGVTVRQMINQKAKDMELKNGVEFERVKLYFKGENIVFYYLPAVVNEINFIEISIPEKELEGLINTSFGEKPAS